MIVHSCPVWLPQTQTWMYTQVAELQRLGAKCHVVCDSTENLGQFAVQGLHSLAEKGRIFRLRDHWIRRLRLRHYPALLVEVGRDVGARVIHSHFGNVGWSNLGAVRELGARHVVTFYGYEVNKLPQQHPVWRRLYLQLFEEVDSILCEGSHMAGCIVALGCPAEKVKVHHLGVDVERFEYKPRSWRPGEVLKVLIAASFREKKGIPYAIDALGSLAGAVELEVTIIGDAGEDAASREEKARIMQAIERTGLARRVRLLGYQPHEVMMKEAYAHHIFLHPSVTAADGDTEGGAPVSIIEMLATGMPVVSTAHCDIPEVMGKDAAHLLAPERDSAELGRILRNLLEAHQGWEDISARCRKRMEEEYNAGKQAVRLLEHYNQVCAGAHAGCRVASVPNR